MLDLLTLVCLLLDVARSLLLVCTLRMPSILRPILVCSLGYVSLVVIQMAVQVHMVYTVVLLHTVDHMVVVVVPVVVLVVVPHLDTHLTRPLHFLNLPILHLVPQDQMMMC